MEMLYAVVGERYMVMEMLYTVVGEMWSWVCYILQWVIYGHGDVIYYSG